MESGCNALKANAEKIAFMANEAKMTDAQAAYFAGWIAGAVAMAKQVQPTTTNKPN